jgi:hypothetical protein
MIGEDDEISRKRGREPRREDEPCVPAAISANSRSRIGGQPDATAAPFPTREQLKAMLEFATRRRDWNRDQETGRLLTALVLTGIQVGYEAAARDSTIRSVGSIRDRWGRQSRQRSNRVGRLKRVIEPSGGPPVGTSDTVRLLNGD